MKTPFLALACVLAVACGSSSDDAKPMGAAGAGSTRPCDATIRLIDYKLNPKKLEAAPGPFELCTENAGEAPHDLGVRDPSGKDVGVTPTLGSGETAHLSLELVAGDYQIYCAEPGHESLGMRGTLTVK